MYYRVRGQICRLGLSVYNFCITQARALFLFVVLKNIDRNSAKIFSNFEVALRAENTYDWEIKAMSLLISLLLKSPQATRLLFLVHMPKKLASCFFHPIPEMIGKRQNNALMQLPILFMTYVLNYF